MKTPMKNNLIDGILGSVGITSGTLTTLTATNENLYTLSLILTIIIAFITLVRLITTIYKSVIVKVKKALEDDGKISLEELMDITKFTYDELQNLSIDDYKKLIDKLKSKKE